MSVEVFKNGAELRKAIEILKKDREKVETATLKDIIDIEIERLNKALEDYTKSLESIDYADLIKYIEKKPKATKIYINSVSRDMTSYSDSFSINAVVNVDGMKVKIEVLLTGKQLATVNIGDPQDLYGDAKAIVQKIFE